MRIACGIAGLSLMMSSAFALDASIEAHVEGGAKPRIEGRTNLPSGTELMITIERRDIKYSAQDKTVVYDGKFSSTTFSDKGRGLMAGTYGVEVMMPMPSVQSNSVRAVIGAKGQNLKGKLVKTGIVGEKLVEYKTTFKIGGESAKSAVATRRAESERDLEQWKAQACIDVCKLTAAVATKRGEPFSYRKCLADCPSK